MAFNKLNIFANHHNQKNNQMKAIFTLVFSSVALFSLGQNSAPQIEITSAEADETAETITLNYSLADADGDACEVWLKMSVDGGTYFEIVPAENISGNIGTGIAASQSLSLVWDYSGLAEPIGSVNIQLYASDNQTVEISEMVSLVDEAELLSTLQTVVGERHYTAAPAHLANVRSFVMDAFIDANLQTEAHDFVFNGHDMQNILGRKPGAKAEDITFIIDAHFDGVPNSPAADDNGSGVAGVLEALRILSQYTFEHSIRFIGFDAEELGLIGSNRYVQQAIEPYEDIQGVLNFEMIGFYSDEPNSQEFPWGFDILFPEATQEVADDEYRGNFLFACGNTTSDPLLSAFIAASENYVPELRLVTASVPGTGTIAPDLRRSDHANFWDANMQALMLTDASEFRNPYYHTPGDSLGTLNLEFMKNVVKATLATAAELAVPISAGFDALDLATITSVGDHSHHFPADVRIFPNPSNGLLSLQVEGTKTGFNSRVEVYELSGKRVHREVFNFQAGTSTTTIDLEGLSAGSYMLILYSDDATKSIGFVISD